MDMDKVIEFLHMGGYAMYVWSSYGIVFALLIYNVVLPSIRRKKLLKEINAISRRKQS